ncbi:Hypothetical predicted protein [Scomber scombrus]|uniref:Uncharacterized protein n=1 Tax=Scomber scombrus TaxID=13677 RepID=A0AAV1P7D3_SCOSC
MAPLLRHIGSKTVGLNGVLWETAWRQNGGQRSSFITASCRRSFGFSGSAVELNRRPAERATVIGKRNINQRLGKCCQAEEKEQRETESANSELYI